MFSRIVLQPVPKNLRDSELILHVTIKNTKIFDSEKCKMDIDRTSYSVVLSLEKGIPLCGDIKIEFFTKEMLGKESLCSFWFNPFFHSEVDKLELKRNEIDKVIKDKNYKIFDIAFSVSCYLSQMEEEKENDLGLSNGIKSKSLNNSKESSVGLVKKLDQLNFDSSINK